MGSRSLGVLVLMAIVVACGADPDGAAPTAPSTSTSARPPATTAAAVDIRRCGGTPFHGSSGGAGPTADASERAAAFAAAHSDVVAGTWWDGATGEVVFAAVDTARISEALATELADVPHRVEAAARGADALTALQARSEELMVRGIEVGSSPRAWDGVLALNVPILDEATLTAVRDVYADDLSAICVTGADPATVPPDGPQPTGGDGWRLLADQPRRGEPYTAHVATTADEYAGLWAALALDGQPPPVDHTTELVVHFGAVFSGSCPEIRLDGIDVRTEPPGVYARIVRLGGDRMCTDDANPRAYVVAIARDVLPPTPFEVAVEPGRGHCEGTVVDDTPVVPAGGTLVPGEPAAFDVYAHCGVRVLGNLNGQWWVIDEPGSDGFDWLPPEWAPDDGTVFGSARAIVVLAADRSTITATRGGRSVVYRPAGPDLAAIGGGCA